MIMQDLKLFMPPIASDVEFDNSTNGFTSDNVQSAIEEIGASASPGFSLGRSSTTGAGTWLLRVGSIPSNVTGIPMGISNPILTNIQIGNEDISTFSVEIYEHEGNSVNLTLLTTVTVTSARTGIFSVSVVATQGRQLAAKVSSGTARNIGVDLILKGAV
jgi:hypothetical protein